MYARVTFGQVEPDQLEQYLDKTRASAIPSAQEQPGYEGALMLVDPENGKFIGISLYQTEAARQAVEDSGVVEVQRTRTGSLHNVIWSDPEYYQVRIVDGTFRAVTSDSQV